MLFKRVTGLPRWGIESPCERLENLKRQMDWLADGFSRGYSREPAAGVFPLINVTEDKDNYYVRAELPGINASELDISVTGDSISISGERKLPVEDEKAQYHRRERDAGKFSRILSLPAQINTANVEARSADGVLTIVLPKAEEAKPRQIAVKAS